MSAGHYQRYKLGLVSHMHELLGCELGVSLCVTALQEPELHGAMVFTVL